MHFSTKKRTTKDYSTRMIIAHEAKALKFFTKAKYIVLWEKTGLSMGGEERA